MDPLTQDVAGGGPDRSLRAANLLLLHDQDAVAEACAADGADALMIGLSAAARQIEWAGDRFWAEIDTLIQRSGGQPVSSMSGITTALFDSSQGAIECGRRLSDNLGVAVGIHAGEPSEQPAQEADPALVVAVRAAGLAGGGRVAVSNIIRELAAGKGFSFEQFEDEADGEGSRLFALR